MLDAIPGVDVPALEPIDGTPAQIWVQLVVAMDQLVRLRGTIESWRANG